MQIRAARLANEPEYNPMSSADRAKARKAREAAAAAAAEAAAAERERADAAGETLPNGMLPLEADFWWSTLEEDYWYPPPSSSVALVLSEFVGSDYARAVFNNVRAPGTDYGRIGGMFQSVRLRNGTVELTLRQDYNNIEGLLDRLTKYFRARIPHLQGVHQVLADGVNIL